MSSDAEQLAWHHVARCQKRSQIAAYPVRHGQKPSAASQPQCVFNLEPHGDLQSCISFRARYRISLDERFQGFQQVRAQQTEIVGPDVKLNSSGLQLQ
jgi:hypothetical protein